MHEVTPPIIQPNPYRPSMTMTLQDRYNAAPSLTSAGNAKLAGNPGFLSTDVLSTGDDEFQPLQYPAGIANDARSVQVNTWNTHGGPGFLQVDRYAPSGRL